MDKIPFIKTNNLDYEFYELQKDIDYFGEIIKRGTRFYESSNSKDWYIPVIKGCVCPNEQLHFTFLKNNSEYFIYIIAITKRNTKPA